jgi:hypothetical protein
VVVDYGEAEAAVEADATDAADAIEADAIEASADGSFDAGP